MKEGMIERLRNYFSTQPVERVWLFGSFARGEETPASDVDLMIAYDEQAHVTLFTMGGIYMDLRQLLGREVDLVEEGQLEPYAAATADRDKQLIYERAS